MNNNNTDNTFFTNTGNDSLLERFKKTLQHVENFDVLVGYFRTSGFHLLLIKNLKKLIKLES